MTADLFATGAAPRLSMGLIDEQIPYLAIDGVFADPIAVRSAALALPYSTGAAHYPGRVARFPSGDPSLTEFLRKVVALVTREYLPLLPPLPGGRRLSQVRGADTDFAITDTHPAELSPKQREPHIDAIPIFGLVYLNEEPRGGTLFFKPRGGGSILPEAAGYPRPNARLEACGHIEGRFNRLTIYPGFILHSGEIEGEWIEGEDRLSAPRLTQRIMFFF